MSRSRRARLNTLQDRMNFLERKIEEWTARGGSNTFDKAEFAALRWAMPVLEAHVAANCILQEQLKEEKDSRG